MSDEDYEFLRVKYCDRCEIDYTVEEDEDFCPICGKLFREDREE